MCFLYGNDDHLSVATHNQVLDVARGLGYRPNAMARSMVRQKTAIIGLIISELQNLLFVPVTVSAEEVLRQEGYQIIRPAPRRFGARMISMISFW